MNANKVPSIGICIICGSHLPSLPEVPVYRLATILLYGVGELLGVATPFGLASEATLQGPMSA